MRMNYEREQIRRFWCDLETSVIRRIEQFADGGMTPDELGQCVQEFRFRVGAHFAGGAEIGEWVRYGDPEEVKDWAARRDAELGPGPDEDALAQLREEEEWRFGHE